MKLALLAGAMLLGTPATAQVFIGAGGGLTVPKDTSLQMKTNRLDVLTHDGWNGNVVAGVKTKRLRFEIEARRTQMTVSRITGQRGGSFEVSDGSQSRREDSAFANLYYTQPMNDERTVGVFVGGGVGVSRLLMRAKYGTDCSERLAVRVVHTDKTGREAPDGGACADQGKGGDPVFSWQAMAGLDLRFSPTSKWTISPTARYVRHENVETAGKSLPTREVRFRDKIDYSSWQAAIVLRRGF